MQRLAEITMTELTSRCKPWYRCDINRGRMQGNKEGKDRRNFGPSQQPPHVPQLQAILTLFYRTLGYVSGKIQGVKEKLWFFTIHCNSSLACIAVRDLQALNALRMYSHSYWLVIFVQPIAAECWRGRGGKLSRILGKNTFIYKVHIYFGLKTE